MTEEAHPWVFHDIVRDALAEADRLDWHMNNRKSKRHSDTLRRTAALLRELARYATERDAALARCVHDKALLMARLEGVHE